MKISRPILMLGLIMLLAGLSCNFPTRTIENSPANSLPGQPTGEAPAAPEEEPNIDFSSAGLTLADLPAGYQQLSDEDLAGLGFSRDSITGSFTGMLSRAQTQSFTGFMQLNPPGYSMVLSTIIAPVTTLEKVAIDAYFSQPEIVAADFAEGSGSGDVQVLGGMENIGNRAVGMTFTRSTDTGPVRADVVVSRRGGAIQVAMVLYPDGMPPNVGVADVASVVDGRLSALQP